MKPSERFKKRYVSFVLSVGGVTPALSETKAAVHEHFLSFFGELGISSLAFKLVKYDSKTGKGVLRCARGSVDEAVFCMACMKEIGGKTARLEPLSTSGTIRRV